ncbi:hypothetical protein FB446DRAFT_709676 [Lentinula raphanica]|nr:hypothetical protein FB446DRAFT_709676 [Lentinula raphanica]
MLNVNSNHREKDVNDSTNQQQYESGFQLRIRDGELVFGVASVILTRDISHLRLVQEGEPRSMQNGRASWMKWELDAQAYFGNRGGYGELVEILSSSLLGCDARTSDFIWALVSSHIIHSTNCLLEIRSLGILQSPLSTPEPPWKVVILKLSGYRMPVLFVRQSQTPILCAFQEEEEDKNAELKMVDRGDYNHARPVLSGALKEIKSKQLEDVRVALVEVWKPSMRHSWAQQMM